MKTSEMTAKIAQGDGFIAALDQSGGSTPKALKGYGVDESAWSSDEEMFELIHQMRSRIITSPCFGKGKVIGAILFEKTMNGEIDGKKVPAVLHEIGVVPFIKIDKGLEDEANGVQMMKPMPELEHLLDHARAFAMYGTKERSVIHSANREGIAAIVAQQIEFGQRVLKHGLMPILEPEVNITSESRAECDRILLDELNTQLSAMPGNDKVMLKLSLPVEPGTFDPLVDHPRVLKVVALSGGYSRDEACAELARNKGIIASFSRALLSDLRHGMSDDEFDSSLNSAIDAIHAGSTQGG